MLEDISDNLRKIESDNGKMIYSKSQRIGPGVGAKQNIINSSLVQKTSDAAATEAAYRDSRLRRNSKDVSASIDIDESVIDRYLMDYIDDMLGF